MIRLFRGVKIQWTVPTLITTYVHRITSVLLLMAATHWTVNTMHSGAKTYWQKNCLFLWKNLFLEFLLTVQWWEHFAGMNVYQTFKERNNKIGNVGSKGTHIRLLILLRDLKFLWCSLCQSPFLWMLEV